MILARQKAEGGRQTRAAARHFRGFVLALGFVLVASIAAAQPPPPQLTETVNDFAGVIDSGSAREMDRWIRALQQKTGDTIVVATVRTFQPYATIDEYAVKMFENGGKGIGQRGKDNGVLVVVAVDDRRVRIEVGYALEEFITDGYAGETIRNTILPELQNNAYGRGLLAGVTRLVNRIAAARGVTLEGVPQERSPVQAPAEFPGWMLVLIAWIVIALIANGRNRRRRRRFWGGGPWSGWNSGVGPFGGGGFGGGFGGFGGAGGRGGGFGGFGGFGGGRSGGGGASGGW